MGSSPISDCQRVDGLVEVSAANSATHAVERNLQWGMEVSCVVARGNHMLKSII